MTTAEPRPPGSPTARAAGEPAAPYASVRREFWRRALRGWDIAFYAGVTISAVALAVDTRGTDLVTALVALLMLVAAYTLLGRRAARTGDRRLAVTYLVVLVVLTVLITLTSAVGTVLLFIAYSQVWFFAESRRGGVVGATVLTVGVFGALALHGGSDGMRLTDIATQGALALGFSVLLGLWITQVAEQSEERADLIEKLESAQAELGRSQHAAGVMAERARMAQEIHDTLAQGFTSIIMLTQTAAGDVRRGDGDRAVERLDLAERTARENLAEARALVAAFGPVGLQDGSLAEALRRLAERFAQETGVDVDVVVPEDGPALPREREVILLRAAQEALSNVRRHAHAGHVQLVLARTADDGGTAVDLEVVDDGTGFDPGREPGTGLRGMRERVASGGGELAVTSGADGTRVRVHFPAVSR